MVKHSALIPSALSTGVKTVSNIGIFVLIGHFYDNELFSQYILMSALATFLAFIADFGYATKIVVDFTANPVSVALKNSFMTRFFVFAVLLALVSLLFVSFHFNWLFLFVFFNVVFSYWLESFSFKLRFEGKYWSEFLFSSWVNVLPFICLIYFIYTKVNLEWIFMALSAFKLITFIYLYSRVKVTERNEVSLKSEINDCFKFVLDSMTLNAQPLLQVYLAKIFLEPSVFVAFGYAQKIIQAFNTLFSALNNVFYPKLARNLESRMDIIRNLKNFGIAANSLPILLLLVYFVFQHAINPMISVDLSPFYQSILTILPFCLILVLVRFNSAILGSLLTLFGRQKFRATANVIMLFIEIGLLSVFLKLFPNSEVVVQVLISSNLLLFVGYLWAVKNDKNICNIVFNTQKTKS
ncbi:TPA: polysaccharide biosynthesis protein [Vibrio cholerae]|nr:polysaccharide biosynthesis protein [Vibrio cholerae]